MAEKKTKTEDEVVVEAPKAETDREIRWKEFLVKAREVNPVRFDLQLANGEFKVIPDSFN